MPGGQQSNSHCHLPRRAALGARCRCREYDSEAQPHGAAAAWGSLVVTLGLELWNSGRVSLPLLSGTPTG